MIWLRQSYIDCLLQIKPVFYITQNSEQVGAAMSRDGIFIFTEVGRAALEMHTGGPYIGDWTQADVSKVKTLINKLF